MATGLYQRGINNAAKVGLRHNRIESPLLPKVFDGLTIVQLSDIHVEMSKAAMGARDWSPRRGTLRRLRYHRRSVGLVAKIQLVKEGR
jgi:hypothetical protein